MGKLAGENCEPRGARACLYSLGRRATVLSIDHHGRLAGRRTGQSGSLHHMSTLRRPGGDLRGHSCGGRPSSRGSACTLSFPCHSVVRLRSNRHAV